MPDESRYLAYVSGIKPSARPSVLSSSTCPMCSTVYRILGFHTEKDYIFQGIPRQFPVGRYHSWVVSDDGLPSCLEVTAVSPEGQIMALRHREYDIHGIQFHPESVLTPNGRAIVENFLGHTLCP